MASIAQGTKIGPYTVVRALPVGKGGMARVYIARLERGGMAENALTFALKVAAPSDGKLPEERVHFYTEALSNEVEILKRLRHPHIVRIYAIPWGSRTDPYLAKAVNVEGQPWFCAMEYLEGGSLQDLIAKRGKLQVKEAAEIASQIGSALEYIHAQEIAHLDVKPDNVLFRVPPGKEAPDAVLVDFGIATRTYKLGLDAGAVSYLAPERVQILRGELSPEQARDQRPVDVYSMGLLLYRMLSGTLPFKGKDKAHISTAILKNTPVPPSSYNKHIPAALNDLILKALEKDPQQRPTIHEFNASLNAIVPAPRYAQRETPPPNPVESKPKPRRRSIALVGLVPIVALGSIFFGQMVIRDIYGSGTTATVTAAAAVTLRPTRTPTLLVTSVPQNPTDSIPNILATSTLAPTDTPIPIPSVTPSPLNSPVTTTVKPATPTPNPQRVDTAGMKKFSNDSYSFWIDTSQVRNAEFDRFVTATGLQTLAEKRGWSDVWTGNRFEPRIGANWRNPQGPGSGADPNSAVVQITRDEADAYCQWARKRLPTFPEFVQAFGSPPSREWMSTSTSPASPTDRTPFRCALTAQ